MERIDTSQFISATQTLLINGLIIVAPALIASLLIAVLVSVFQSIFQIQEQTLSFLPKMLVLVLMIILLGSPMLSQLLTLIQNYILSISGMMG